MKRLLNDVLARRHARSALGHLRRLEAKVPSREARFAIPFAFRGSGHFRSIEPRQNPVEIETLYRAICELAPARVLEIGTSRGGSLYLWAQAARDDATIVSVDMPGGAFGGSYPPCREPFYRAFARNGQTIHLLRADSHQQQTFEQVRVCFDAQPIDFAFIDGDHTYAGVKDDFERYSPLVRSGGLIAFHDILPGPKCPASRSIACGRNCASATPHVRSSARTVQASASASA